MNNKHEQAFLEAYDAFADAIFRHCYFRVSDRERAKDLMQETFTRAWQHLKGGEDVTNIKAYLYQIANNLIVDYYRKKKDLSLDIMQEEGFDPGFDDREHLENFIAGSEAKELLGQLDDSHREVIVMRYIDDLSVTEIANTIGVSQNVVSVRLYRALKKLRNLFHQD